MLGCFDNFFFARPTGGCGDGSSSGQQEFLYLLGFLRPDIFRNTLPHTWVFLHIFSITFSVQLSSPSLFIFFLFFTVTVCFTRTQLCSLSLSFYFPFFLLFH